MTNFIFLKRMTRGFASVMMTAATSASRLKALILCLTVLLAPLKMTGQDFEFGGTQYADFDDALAAAEAASGGTIKLLASSTYSYSDIIPLSISSANITIDLDGYTLDVENTAGTGFIVSGVSVALTGAGAFNVKGTDIGLSVNSGTVTVTNVESFGYGVYAYNGSNVTVRGSVTAYAEGVWADNATVNVQGDVLGIHGVKAEAGSIVTVGGNVTGDSYYGVFAETGAKVYVTGTVAGASGAVNVSNLITAVTTPNQTLPAPYDGYYWDEYTDNKSYVYKRQGAITPPVAVCEYGGVQYADFDAALAAAQVASGGTIKLLATSTYTYSNATALTVTTPVTIDLNGYTLNVENTGGDGLYVNSGSVALTGSGAFNVKGYSGLKAVNGTATVTNAEGTDVVFGFGVHATNNSSVTVRGNATGIYCGVHATGATVNVQGNVSGNLGVGADSGGVVTVAGNVTGIIGYGASVSTGGKVYVAGTIAGVAGAANFSLTATSQTLAAPHDDYYWDVYTDNTSYVYKRQGAIPVSPQPPAGTAPRITGPASMKLKVDYAATSTAAFTVAGSPSPSVTRLSGDSRITWNASTHCLDIAPGLEAGEYPVELRASNSIGSFTFTFTLTVERKVYYVGVALSYAGGKVEATTAGDNPWLAVEGSEVTLTATPDAGYRLDTLYAVDYNNPRRPVPLTGSGLTRTFTMPAHHITVVAVFRLTGVSVEDIGDNRGMKVYLQDGILYISGAAQGSMLRVYNITGALIYQGVADGSETHGLQIRASNFASGVYIVTDGMATIKVMN